jgi:MFS family permease
MRILRARTRVLIGFAALGVWWGAFGAALPAVQSKAEAGDAELGLGLLLVGLGALVSMRATGVLMDRAGPALTPAAIGLFGLTGLLPALADSPNELYLCLLVVGATSGAMDVAINADAVNEEVLSGRPLLNLAHASFSAAVVFASLLTGLLRSEGAGSFAVFALASALVLIAAVATRPGSSSARGWTPVQEGEAPRFAQRVPGWLLALGVLGAMAFWIESAWQNWGAVHLERTFDAAAGTSALAPALFAGAMAVGRLTVHRVAPPGSERKVLVAAAALTAAGSALAAYAGSPLVALAGIVVAGAGCAVCAPTIISIAGRAAKSKERATAVGSLTTVMYLGFLVGPAAVGGLAELTTLRAALGSVAALALLLMLLFTLVRFPAAQRGEEPGMAGKRVLVVTTVPADESSLREAISDADEIRVVAPAADVSFLQWLTNDEDDARRQADEAAKRVASAARRDTRVEIDRTSGSTDAAEAIRDALRDFGANEIVVVTRPGDDSTWLEDETVRAALDAHSIPVHHRELSPTG